MNIHTDTFSTFCLCSWDCKCSTKIWEVLKCFLQTVQEEMAVLLASWGETERRQIITDYSYLKTTRKAISNIFKIFCKTSWAQHLQHVKWTADYFVLLSATVVHDATGEVGVTGGTPVLRVCFLLSAENTDEHYSRIIRIIFPVWG